jgi:hypothetical protein
MANCGDLVRVPTRISGDYLATQMATAIYRSYTSDGFVVGADGRVGGPFGTETGQKIFCFGTNRSVAYAFTGMIQLGPEDTPEVDFDFIEQFSRAAQQISSRRCRTLFDYAERLSNQVNRALKDAQRKGRIQYPEDAPSPHEPGGTIANVFADGFHGGFPERARMRFSHRNQVLSDPTVFREELAPGQPFLSGLPEVWERLRNRDADFSKYLAPLEGTPHDSESLSNEISRAHCYIRACSGPEARGLNEKIASGIGGHIHIASVTLTAGFRWVLGLEPISPSSAAH